MPTIDENIEQWNGEYAWAGGGEEWSKPWGNSDAQWHGCIYPRIHWFLPATTILELAPGYGRWTRFLLQQCDRYMGVDLAPKCIEACEDRFSNHAGAHFYTNDGSSLPMVADSSIDFVFCFDSFVHVEAEVLSCYLHELGRVLAPEGVAFIHHSNFGTYRTRLPCRRAAPAEPSVGQSALAAGGNWNPHECRMACNECHRLTCCGALR
jgi:SAM-dependent methyltransferase